MKHAAEHREHQSRFDLHAVVISHLSAEVFDCVVPARLISYCRLFPTISGNSRTCAALALCIDYLNSEISVRTSYS